MRDPDPHAADSGRVLGVRIDVFSRRERRFVQPFYLLLHRAEGAENGKERPARWKLHKHTVPPFVPLQALAKKYLAPGGAQGLARLCRAVRAELVRWQTRVDLVETMKGRTELMRERGVREVRERDLRCEEVEVVFEDGALARVVLGRDGGVAKAVVRGPEEEKDVVSEGMRPGRRRELERAIKGADGSVEGMLERLPLLERR